MAAVRREGEMRLLRPREGSFRTVPATAGIMPYAGRRSDHASLQAFPGIGAASCAPTGAGVADEVRTVIAVPCQAVNRRPSTAPTASRRATLARC
jgi:hypothetical protein